MQIKTLIKLHIPANKLENYWTYNTKGKLSHEREHKFSTAWSWRHFGNGPHCSNPHCYSQEYILNCQNFIFVWIIRHILNQELYGLW